jgi:mono/diheme cytochrome c family protein
MRLPTGVFFLSALVILFTTASCGKRGPFQPVAYASLTYNNGISAILNGTCGGCHGSGSPPDFANYSALMAGPGYVVAGDSASSLIVIKGSGGNSHGGGVKLTGEDLEKVKYWIDNNGAAE